MDKCIAARPLAASRQVHCAMIEYRTERANKWIKHVIVCSAGQCDPSGARLRTLR